MKQEHETRRKIIREWMSLPKDKRQTEEQAKPFAKKAMERTPSSAGGATRRPAATAAGHRPRARATVPLRGRCNRGSSAQHPAVWSAVAGKPPWLPPGTPFRTPPDRIPTYV